MEKTYIREREREKLRGTQTCVSHSCKITKSVFVFCWNCVSLIPRSRLRKYLEIEKKDYEFSQSEKKKGADFGKYLRIRTKWPKWGKVRDNTLSLLSPLPLSSSQSAAECLQKLNRWTKPHSLIRHQGRSWETLETSPGPSVIIFILLFHRCH